MRIIRDSTPAADGFRMPAEYERHEGCIMIFPERPDSWQYGGYAARRAFVRIAESIAGSEKVTVCAGAAQYDNARALLPAHIRVVEMSSNDAWARDYAPVFVKNDSGVSITTTMVVGTLIENIKTNVPRIVTTPVNNCVNPMSRPSEN